MKVGILVCYDLAFDSFAHDHTWDDENLVWQFNDGYPQGFGPAQQLAAKYGEDNARFLHEQLCNMLRNYSGLAFIEMGIEPDDRFERVLLRPHRIDRPADTPTA